MDTDITSLLSLVPKQIPVGSSVLLMNIADAEKYFPGRTRLQVKNIFEDLRIPLIHIGRESFFNLYTLEKVLFYLTRLQGTGYAAPSSRNRDRKPWDAKARNHPKPLQQMTEEDIEAMLQPELEAERLSSGPRGTSRAAYIETLKTRQVAKEAKVQDQKDNRKARRKQLVIENQKT